MENSEGNQHSGAPPPVEGVGGGGTSYGWSDGGCQLQTSISGIIDPSKIPSADLVHVWHMPSTENVGNQGIPQQFEHISLLAARNEKESVQISLRQKVSWGGSGTVRIQCSDLCSPSGDRMVVGQSLTLRQVLPVLGVPDALVPLDLPVSQINLLPGETSSVWLSVDVPIDQPCGQYEGEICITAITSDTESSGKSLAKSEKFKLHQEINDCLDVVQTLQDKPHEEVVERLKVATSTLRRVLMSPTFSEFIVCPEDLMDEDVHNNISIQLKLLVTVWDFTIPQTPSLPAVFGISEAVIEDRFCLKHGSPDWYDALERHFNWLLQYRISPFFCRWGDSMRIFAYTCPWPADHPKSDEYYSNPKLAAYAVPCVPSLVTNETAKNYFKKEMDILRSKAHWKKAYFYLWDEPLNADHFRSINDLSSEIKSYAPDARVLTTYYRGPCNASDSQSSFEAFVKVPNYLRPHTQIFCTRIPRYKDVITRGRRITSFIHSISTLRAEWLKVNGKELVRCGVTRFATSFLTLESLYQARDNLRKFDWARWARNTETCIQVSKYVLSTRFWLTIEDLLRASEPIIKVLRLVDSDSNPTMAYLQGAFLEAKKAITENFKEDACSARPILDILDRRWEKHYKSPLVKAAMMLNPSSYYKLSDEWVLGNRDDLVKDIVSELQPEKGEEWWTYVCMGPPDPQPNWHLGMSGTQHRAVMWRVWKEGGTGFLYWGSNCYEKAMVPSAEVKFRRGLPPGDGVLFYPGEVFSSSHDPVASVRLERALSGLQDIEYLNLYSSRYGREEALALLEKTGIYLGPERYTRDHRSIDAMRAEIYRTCGP